MFTFFKKEENKEENIESADNTYTVLDNELERMHNLLLDQIGSKTEGDGNNSATLYKRIKTLQDEILEALKNRPNNEKTIKDLQNSVADLYLTGTETNDNTQEE